MSKPKIESGDRANDEPVPGIEGARIPSSLVAKKPAELEKAEAFSVEAHHVDFVGFHEGYVRHYIQFADAKAGVGFSLISAVVGYFLGRDQVRSLFLSPSLSLSYVFVVLGIIFLVASAVSMFLVIAPRLKSTMDESIVFFGSVANRKTADQYIQDIYRCTAAELTIARLKHTYDVSKICARKYSLLKRGLWLALPGLSFAFSSILLIGVK